jgi:hypothetical protein
MAPHSRFTSVVLATAAALVLSLASLSPAASAQPEIPRARDVAIRVVLELPTLPVPEVAPAAPVDAGPDWSIAIDTSGWQDELDLCLWVRMDFEGVVPMVGAHNFCGGSFILDVVAGQTVQLSGQGLDGRYLVTGDRQVFSGDDAIQATSGLSASVILQTCYWDAADGMRLVALTLL